MESIVLNVTTHIDPLSADLILVFAIRSTHDAAKWHLSREWCHLTSVPLPNDAVVVVCVGVAKCEPLRRIICHWIARCHHVVVGAQSEPRHREATVVLDDVDSHGPTVKRPE